MSAMKIPRRELLLSSMAALAASWLNPTLVSAAPEKTKVTLAVGGKSALYYLALTIASMSRSMILPAGASRSRP
jgi:NitT/TauT family transport system substrate-binding protein